jgi:hypothetical protein
MVAMARPVVVVVDAEDASRQALTRELEGRYGADYRIVSNASPEEAGIADLNPVQPGYSAVYDAMAASIGAGG